MRKVLLFICFLSCIFFVNAQTYTIELTEPARTWQHSIPEDLIMSNESGTYFLESTFIGRNKKEFLCHFPKKGESSRNEIYVPFENTHGYKFFTIQDRMLRLIKTKDKKTKTLTSFIVEYGKDATILSTKELDKHAYSKKKNLPKQWTSYSQDSSKLIVIDYIDTDDKKIPFEIRPTIINENLEVNHLDIINKGAKSQKKYHFINARISNNGDVFILWKYFKDHNKKRIKVNGKWTSNYNYELTTIRKGEKSKTAKIFLSGFSRDAHLYLTEKEKVLIVSLINKNHKENASLYGISTHLLNDEDTGFNSLEYLFSKEEFSNWGFKKGKIKDSYMNDFRLLKDMLYNDNLLYIYAERFFINNGNDGQEFCSKTALVLGIDEDGELVEDIFIPKCTAFYIDSRPSMLAKIDGYVGLLYNDYKRNADDPLTKLSSYEDTNKMLASNKFATFFAFTNKKNKIEKKLLPEIEDYVVLGHCSGAYNGAALNFGVLQSFSFKKSKFYLVKIQ